MTISNSARSAGPYVGNDARTVFPFGFKVFGPGDLLVARADYYAAQPLALNSDYTVDLNPDQDLNPGGTVTLMEALASGLTLSITSAVTEVQGVSLTNLGGFYPKVIEAALDRLTILIQQVRGVISRSLHYPFADGAVTTELPALVLRAGKLLGFDAAGAPVAVSMPALNATEMKYHKGMPVMLMHIVTGGSGSRNVIQGHWLDMTAKALYALQLKDSADSFWLKRVTFGNPRIPGNFTETVPQANLIVHQGLFLETVGAERWFWAGGDSSLQPQLVACREGDGAVATYQFNPAASPVAAMGSGAWAGNATMCRDLSGTKLFIRLSRGSQDYVLRYDFAAFKASSTTTLAEACWPVATEQYSGTSFQGIAADEDRVYVLSGNTIQTQNKLLYAYDYAGNIIWQRAIAPHYFESFRMGTKCEVEGLQIVQLPNGQRMLTMMTEMGSSTHNIHRLYVIPQYLSDASFAAATPGIYMNDYGMTSVGGMPVGDDACLFQVVNEKLETTRFGVRGLQSIGPTGGGMQMVIGSDNTANWVQRENAPATFWTNNTSRMVLASDRARLDIGLGETGPQTGNISPGYRLGLNIGALSTGDATTTEQEILRMGWSEGSQDLGIGEGIYASFGATLNGGVYQPLMNIGISKVSNSDSTTGSYGFIASSPGTGQAPIKYINWTNTGTFFPLADASQVGAVPLQDLGTATAHWRDTYTKNIRLGAGTTIQTSGTGSPEGVITAAVGSRYWREDGATGTRLYWKNTGTGSTGWLAIL